MFTCWIQVALIDSFLRTLSAALATAQNISLGSHFRRASRRIRDADALGQSWPRFWLIEYAAWAMGMGAGGI